MDCQKKEANKIAAVTTTTSSPNTNNTIKHHLCTATFAEFLSRLQEANMPLQLNVSCVDYDDYCGVVKQLAVLLKDSYSIAVPCAQDQLIDQLCRSLGQRTLHDSLSAA